MELKEAILKLPNLLERVEKFLTPTVPVAPVAAAAPEVAPKGTEVKTKDGKVLSYIGESPAVGVDIMLDGAPAPDGNFELETGNVIVVQGGKIVDVQEKAVEAAQAPAPVAQASTAPAAPTPNPTKVTKYTETVFDAQFAEVDALKLAFAEQSKMLKDLIGIVQTIAEQPSEKTKFSKKDGVATKVGIDKMIEDAKDFSKRAFKN